MPQTFLAKTEPSSFSISDFVRDQITPWDGVHNYQAINVIKTWNIGDIVLIYHSVKEAQIVGIAQVITQPIPNLGDLRPSVVADLRLLRVLEPSEYVTIKQVKASGLFDDWYLVKQSRLSVMPVPDNFLTWLGNFWLPESLSCLPKITSASRLTNSPKTN